MDTNYDKIAEAIEFVSKHAQQQPELETIAAAVHTSPFHFQRLFTEWAGVSPKKFLQYLTVEHAKQLLAEKQNSLFDAAYETGLSGTGRLHDLFVNIEGMTPGEYKNGGEALTIHYSIQTCRFGKYIVASTGKGICNLSFFEGTNMAAVNGLQAFWSNAKLMNGLDDNQQKIIRFFNNDTPDAANIKLHLRGTAFQLKVWHALLHIPEGDVSTYGGIAQHLQQAGASRSVGTAIGRNPVGYIIPCHRVIRNIGETGGYRWGVTRKKAMLAWEAGKVSNKAVGNKII
jgi:AraC family transcriptional regulator, regulatory protein of adaptative response / methylated-DNA-[protein]-cysteine methyltransferase